jgi:hypothetical protein
VLVVHVPPEVVIPEAGTSNQSTRAAPR